MERGWLRAGRAIRPPTTLGLTGAVSGLLIIAVLLHRCEAQSKLHGLVRHKGGLARHKGGHDLSLYLATQKKQLCCCTARSQAENV